MLVWMLQYAPYRCYTTKTYRLWWAVWWRLYNSTFCFMTLWACNEKEKSFSTWRLFGGFIVLFLSRLSCSFVIPLWNVEFSLPMCLFVCVSLSQMLGTSWICVSVLACVHSSNLPPVHLRLFVPFFLFHCRCVTCLSATGGVYFIICSKSGDSFYLFIIAFWRASSPR